MDIPLTRELHWAANWSIVVSLLMIAVGAFALLEQPMAGAAVTALFGCALIGTGILHVALANRMVGGATAWELLLAALDIAVGFFLIAKPASGLEALTIALAIYLVLAGGLEFMLSLTLWPLPGSGWVLLHSAICLLLTVIIWTGWPASSSWVLGTLVGISIIVNGLTRLVVSVVVARATPSGE